MKKIFLLIVIAGLGLPVLAQVQMQQTTIAANTVNILLPASFEKQGSEEPGITKLWDKSDAVSLSYRLLTDSITDNETSQFVDRILKETKHDYNAYKYIDDGIHLQNWKNIGYIKFSSKEKRQQYFNYIFFISVNDKPLVFTFSCFYKQRKKWEPIADTIANSLRINE